MIAQISFRGVELWFVAGWTMLHYLWLGTLLGLAAMAIRLLLRRVSADVRYVVALISLAALAAMPAGIGAWLIAKPHATVAKGGLVARFDEGPNTAAPTTGEIIELKGTSVGPSDATITGTIVMDEAATKADAASPLRAPVDGAMKSIGDCVLYLPWLWLVGTPLTFAILVTGIVGAERLRRTSRIIDVGPPADACARLRQSLGVSRRVAVAVCERIAAPVLVGILRPIILLPPSALTGWSPDEIEMVLLHELAHVRRWDNLVNLIQRLIESLLFFHPAVWLVSGWVRREREACCDEMVVRRTNRPQAYAEMLVALAAQMPRSVLFHPAASSAMAAGPLRSRIRRILQLEDDPMLVSGKSFAFVLAGLLVAGTLAVLYLPTVGQAEESTTEVTETTELKHSVIQGDSIENPKSSTAEEFPYTVRFEAGASRFFDGDNITVLEVRGTAETFTPGNTYSIKGTYTLGSRDRAQLSAFVTAMDAANGTSPIQKIQTTVVNRGEGTFELVLPMLCRGWPHVSFYPADGGDGFGGNYFGTGDSVLKKWWGANEDNTIERTTTSKPVGMRAARFPTLDDQKLADLAWKTLQLELEPIGEEDLKHVQALGYDGGLKVVGGHGDMMSQDKRIEWDDILVGLHVWPTRNMKDLADVLNREDLAELNPLKFYTVRQRISPDPNNPVVSDEVYTGRIAVREEPRSFRRARLNMDNYIKGLVRQYDKNGDLMLQADEQKSLSGKAATADLDNDGVITVDELASTVLAIKSKTGADPFAATPANPYAPTVGQSPVAAVGPHAQASATEPSSAPTTSTAPWGETAANPYPGPSNRTTDTSERSLLFNPSGPADAAQPQATGGNRNNLRYDGKTFGQWSEMWRNELSTERRLEAVNALAAFGAAGYGKEAAEAILDVVKQYDWLIIGTADPVSQLKNQAILAFAGNNEVAARIPMDDWLPVLVDGVRSGDKRISMFAPYVFQNLNYEREDVRKLVELSHDESLRSIKPAILERLKSSYYAFSTGNDPEIKKRLVEALNEGPDEAVIAVQALYPSNTVYMGGGGGMGGMGGGMMGGRGYGSGVEAPQPILEYRPELIDVLKNSKPPFSFMVIDALQQLGPKAKPAVPQLLPLLFTLERRPAAQLALAIRSITGADDEVNAFLQKSIVESESPENVKRAEYFLKGIQQYRAAQLHDEAEGVSRSQPGGRGGYSRGYGGEGGGEGAGDAVDDLFGPDQ